MSSRDGSGGSMEPGTDGYLHEEGTPFEPGTDGYPLPPGRAPSVPEPERRDAVGEVEDPWWRRAGFSSFEAYLNGLEAGWERIGWGRSPSVGEIIRGLDDHPDPIPEVSLDRPADGRSAGGRSHRQVGVKLAPQDYELLVEAAESCGVAPSTLARLLVVRSARALVDRGLLSEPG